MARISCIHKTATTTSAAGGPYATIAAWLATVDRPTNGDETGVICDDTTYDENVTINQAGSGGAGIRLTANDGALVTTVDGSAAPNVRGVGPFRDGAGIDSDNGGDLITISVNYVIIDHLSLVQNSSTGTGDACVRITGNRSEIGILYNTIETQTSQTDSDGVYVAGNTAYGKVLVAGCAFFGQNRAGVMREQPDATGTHASTSLKVFHCGGYSDRDSDPLAALVFVSQNSASDTDTVELYNNAGGFYENGGSRVTSFGAGVTARGTPDGSCTWNGRNNFEDGAGLADLDSVDNTAGWVSGSANPSTVAATQTSGTYWVVNNLTAGSADFRPLDAAAGNKIIGGGYPTALVPVTTTFLDTYWDKSTDMRGNRWNPNTPDIGPFSYADHPQVPFLAQGQHI
jgi:hypothetical protein